MKAWKVFINEAYDDSGETHRWLEQQGCQVTVGRPNWEHPGWGYSEGEMVDLCRDVDAVIGASRERYSRGMMEAASRLRVISKYGIGVNNIDVDAATELGIMVTHTPVPGDISGVVEHTLALILGVAKKLKKGESNLRKGKWRELTMELNGKKAGVVGVGRIGMKVGQILQMLGMRVMGYDPYVSANTLQEAGISPVDLETLLRDSDVVTLSVVLTPETQHMIGKKELRMMKPQALLVNTSRGGVVDEKALIEVLAHGWIGGAGLDVFEKEPPDPDHPLLSFENVIMTPHVAGWTEEGQQHIVWAGARNCMDALKGKLPPYIKNPEVIPQWKERTKRLDGFRS